jgi:hypothetical protein
MAGGGVGTLSVARVSPSFVGGFQTPGSHTSQQLGRAAANSCAVCARCMRASTDSKRLVIATPPVPWPAGA